MSSRRAPSVLVTDSRERPPARGVLARPGTSPASAGSRMPTRFISVDNVLQHTSDIPSGQPRGPPAGPRTARAAGRRSSQGGGGLPTLASGRTGQQNVPSRTTKVSEKLVLIPETDEDEAPSDELLAEQAAILKRVSEDENRPLRDEELDVLRKRGGIRGKSYAERLSKVERTDKVSRLTAYCTAQACKLGPTAEFLRTKHEAKTKLYDDCLYAVYHLPFLAGVDGYRLRSRPILKTPGTGKTVLDLEIERSERRDEHEGYFDDDAYAGSPGDAVDDASRDGGAFEDDQQQNRRNLQSYARQRQQDDEDEDDYDEEDRKNRAVDDALNHHLVADAKNFAEMFVFSYGVVVFWNFSESQEKDVLADLTFAGNETGESLATRPLDESDFETEEFHFEYSPDIKRPRVFNDMITLLPRSDHMIKLTISHAIAQSTRLCFFEERMSETMLGAQHIPKRLALDGGLNMTRTEIVRVLGRLFKSRVDINLSSNMLDVPNFFWDSEPTLHPLYVAIRDYLEIDPRIKVLNERLRVFLDLAEILCDSVADAKMSSITWIIIVLICVSILVTVTEVVLRFTMLAKAAGPSAAAATSLLSPLLLIPRSSPSPSSPPSNPPTVNLSPATAPTSTPLTDGNRLAPDLGRKPLAMLPGGEVPTLEELRAWSAALSERERAAVCGSGYVGMTFAGV